MPVISKADYLAAINTIQLYVSQMERRLPKLNALERKDATIGDFDIPARAQNALRKVVRVLYPEVPSNIYNSISVNSFHHIKASDFINAHGMGKKTLTEIIEAFEKYGVKIEYNL